METSKYEENYEGEYWDHLIELMEAGIISQAEALKYYERYNPLWKE